MECLAAVQRGIFVLVMVAVDFGIIGESIVTLELYYFIYKHDSRY